MTKEGLLGFFPSLTYKRYRDLLQAFQTIDAAWHAPSQALYDTLPWKPELITSFITWKKTIDEDAIERVLAKHTIEYLTLADNRYPQLLKEIADPPPCLFVRGSIDGIQPALAVVGTRNPSRYGTQVVHDLIPQLVGHAITTVSGLALGIDALVHDKTLAVSGTTVAVLGSGVDRASVSPRSHVGLSDRIIDQGGAILSEYPPGTVATPYTFPRRNRIIAGLSLGTLVIEAGESSGALITAACSLDYNRDVFAIPHQITHDGGKGTNVLLKQGAILVTDADDLLHALHLKKSIPTKHTPLPALSTTEQAIYAAIHTTPASIDEIILTTQLSNTAVMSTISLLEMKGIIVHMGGSVYAKK